MVPVSTTRTLCLRSRRHIFKAAVTSSAPPTPGLPLPISYGSSSHLSSICTTCLRPLPRIACPSARFNTRQLSTAPSLPSAAPKAVKASMATAAGPEAASAGDQHLQQLWQKVIQVYDKAQTSGACSKTDTQVEVFHDPDLDVDFVLRVATALKAKPQGPPKAEELAGRPSAPPSPWRNPFLPPEPELFVRQLGTAHNLVVNKFNVVAHHVLVTTQEFRSQAEPLYGSDLAATLEVVKAMPEGGVAFYNCGPNSGRSQPHKHLQVVPLPFADGQPPLAPVDGLVRAAAAAAAATVAAAAGPLQPVEVRQVPYKCFVMMLPDSSPSPDQLEAAFSALLQRCFPGYTYTTPVQLDGPPGNAAATAAAASGSVSYNVLMTRGWLMVVPRSTERCGPLALNSLAFAGTILVRSEDELQYVRQTGPGKILASIGEPW